MNNIDAVLTARNISKTYFSTDPPVSVLNGINVDVRRGEFLAVMGASGSGKSTLLYCMSGMDRPTEGDVMFNGRDLTVLDDAAMSRIRLHEMGFVFQQAHFLPNLNIRDNILLPAFKAQPRSQASVVQRVDGLLDRFGLAHVAGHGITEVSGGQLQRASICRALAVEPSILFADEPTGALNSSMSAEVMNALTDVHRHGATVVMVTHDPTCAARAERVAYLRDGQLVDTLESGSWNPAQEEHRTRELTDWLRGLGF